jgi:hypothetical protein
MNFSRRALLALILLGLAAQSFALVPRTVFAELGTATW